MFDHGPMFGARVASELTECLDGKSDIGACTDCCIKK